MHCPCYGKTFLSRLEVSALVIAGFFLKAGFFFLSAGSFCHDSQLFELIAENVALAARTLGMKSACVCVHANSNHIGLTPQALKLC